MTRGGRRSEPAAGEVRRCIATGQTRDKAELIRFVIGPDATVVPDITGKLPGRGIWVSADRAALERAVKRRLFARAARQPVELPDDLVTVVEEQIGRRVVELLALARKAGDAVCGFEKVRELLASGRAAVLLQARDGSERGKSKLRPPPGDGRYITVLSAAELGLAFGREHVIHAALADGGLAARVVDEAARLAGMREPIGRDAAGKDT